jgi:hypothetical protein
MAAKQPAALRCALHEDWIAEIKDTLSDLRVQGEKHANGLEQLVEQRKIQNGRLDRVETRVALLILAFVATVSSIGGPKALAFVMAALGK